MIEITVTSLAQYMRSLPAKQRNLLRNQKFKTDEQGHKKPQIVHYTEARNAVCSFHANGNDTRILDSAIERVTKKKHENPEKDTGRMDDNIRAITNYLQNFAGDKYVVLKKPTPRYVHGEVSVKAIPDLYVEDGGTRKLIKFDFNARKAEPPLVKIILQVMHEAAMSDGIDVLPKNVIYLDVTRQSRNSGSKLGKKMKRDVDAACQNIQDIWPNIKQK